MEKKKIINTGKLKIKKGDLVAVIAGDSKGGPGQSA